MEKSSKSSRGRISLLGWTDVQKMSREQKQTNKSLQITMTEYLMHLTSVTLLQMFPNKFKTNGSLSGCSSTTS